ncbi:hypothetical protein D3C80_1936440 [compost metagenome]
MEQGDQLALLVFDSYVVVAGAAAAALLDAFGGQGVVQVSRGDVVDAAADRDGGVVVTVASKGEGRVGQGKQVAAVASAMALQHVVTHGHADPGSARAC